MRKEETKMKNRISNKMALLGAGVGLTLFAVFGLLPGSFIGGVIGVNLSGAVLGAPLAPSVLARVAIVVGMLIGALGAGTIFTLGGASLGWVLGTAVETVAHWTKKPSEAKAHR